jgi:hypothetical protein
MLLMRDLFVRPKRLVIHPDKCPHERAPDAFDVLKKVNLYLIPSYLKIFIYI